MGRFLRGLAARGHEVLVYRGIANLPDADMAILHVNLSVVPADYVEATARYPVALNGKAIDIRKRNVSRNILASDTDWAGPVIVKTDLNCWGFPEWQASKAAAELRGDSIVEGMPPEDYRVYERTADVPASTWSDARWVVERFLPEYDEHGYHVRSWIFVGEAERCARCRSTHKIIKGQAIADIEYVGVPEFIRSERQRLGLDFGKMDFVIHEGEPVLLDANKTPGQPPSSRSEKDRAPFIDAIEARLPA
jgi:hypothetical protein